MSKDFYLGRILDEKTSKPTSENLIYDPDDLTTHAIITGMTGSGKTGLGVGLLEEAALNNIPALILDPKGDLCNLLLHFPEMRGSDFAPWVDPQTATQKGITIDELGESTAAFWKKGLADWNLTKPNIQALSNAAQYTIYTPGSTAGIPINIISSFEAPKIEWGPNAEVLRERIASTVSALLNLVGMHDIDPLRSREHILLSNLIEIAWKEKRSMTLLDLITQVQNPPFSRLGAFPIDSFFPPDDRMELAILINNFLASPSFQSWSEGQPLDFENLMFTEDGRPKHSIFYLAHLDEDERMFFVSLFFATFESWMRMQRGTGHLRTLIYFDEVMGYLPPVKNPPSRELILRMLKQSRAYGVGLVLATQNPVDVDYKALSNAGTWMIGRLQTERDIERLMEGLRSAGGRAAPADIRKKISSLPKRCFVINNVHESSQQKTFHTRWVMNYLAGPMTRSQIPTLNKLGGAVTNATETKKSVSTVSDSSPSDNSSMPDTTKPVIPGKVHEIYLPISQSPQEAMEEAGLAIAPDAELQNGIHYIPHFFQQYNIQFNKPKFNIRHTMQKAYLAREAPVSSFVDWKDYECDPIDLQDTVLSKQSDATYAALPDHLLPTGSVSSFKTAMVDWLYRNITLPIETNNTLKLYSSPEESHDVFLERCQTEAQDAMEEEAEKIREKYEKSKNTLEDRIELAEERVADEKIDLSQRQMEEMGSHGELLFSLISKRKRSMSKSLSKRRLTANAKEDVRQAKIKLRQYQDQLKDLEKNFTEDLEEIEEKWTEISHDISVEKIPPFKKDILNIVMGVAWLPTYTVIENGQPHHLPAWEKKDRDK